MSKSAGLRSSALLMAAGIAVAVLGYCAADEGIPGQGSLSAVIRQEGTEQHLEFPLEHTDVRASISGLVAVVEVVQHFTNPYEQKIEAVYVFPLPENAAVNDMLMKVGDRTIRGQIKQREEAKQIYEDAKAAGHMAALLEQERPNIFTQSVANIEPGNKILVTIRYVEDLAYDHGSYKFVFPMVVGPRYIPGQPTGRQAGGWAPDTDQVPDASRITPPVLKPDERSGHDIRVSVRLDAGVPIQGLRSKSHEVDIRSEGDSAARVILLPKDRIPNKDFVLEYDVAGESPQMALLTHRSADSGYFTLMIQPQAEFAADEIAAKEMIFVVDNSGSMSGAPIEKCKEAMRRCLKHLNPNDSFQVIRFSETASALADKPLPNTPENVSKGLKYVDDMAGMGGTKMIEGIKASLSFPPDPERLRIVCFMTDGYIGNETEILAAIEQLLGEARLFSFGVGSSVNGYLLDRMAETGRGTVQYVRPDEDTTAAVMRFYERIDKPFLLDIAIDWADLQVADIYPRRIPDLFSAQPIIIHGRYQQPGSAAITLSGTVAGKPYSQKLPVELPEAEAANAALASLWARARIADLMARMYRGEVPELVEEVTRIGLEFRLMTAYTSFVAVEEKVVTEGGQPKTVQVPVPMPEHVSYEGVFGSAKGEVRRAMGPLAMAGPAGPAGARGQVFQTRPIASLADAASIPAEEQVVTREPISDPVKYLQGRNLLASSSQPLALEEPITRYELAAILDRALSAYQIAKPTATEMPFSDVPQRHWAWQAVINMAATNLMSGRADGTFAGAEPLTRRQFAEVIANLLKLAGLKPMWGSIGGIQMMLDYALWDQAVDHNYRPADAITRAEAYATLARAARLIEQR